MTEEAKAEFKAKMDAAKAAKKPTAPAGPTSSRTATRSAKTQREIDLERMNAELEDENGSLKTEKSALEKFIENITRTSKPKTAAAAAADEDGGWAEFANNPW